jgi:hypothetical protein
MDQAFRAAGRPAKASRHAQAPGFQRVRVGDLLITGLYDGFVLVLADDVHDEPLAEVRRLLAEAFLPPEGSGSCQRARREGAHVNVRLTVRPNGTGVRSTSPGRRRYHLSHRHKDRGRRSCVKHGPIVGLT